MEGHPHTSCAQAVDNEGPDQAMWKPNPNKVITGGIHPGNMPEMQEGTRAFLELFHKHGERQSDWELYSGYNDQGYHAMHTVIEFLRKPDELQRWFLTSGLSTHTR